MVGLGVVLRSELKNSRRGDDLRFGRLQDRILAGCWPARESTAESTPNRVFARRQHSRALVYLGSERLVLRSQVTDPGRDLGEAAVRGWIRALDRYIRVRSRHGQAHRPQLWPGVNNRGPVTANGIYQMIARGGRQAGVDAWTHRFRHHFSHTWLDRGGAEGGT